MNLDQPEYWSIRYNENQTGWDIGYPSPPIIEYFNQLEDKEVRILIPGCGNAYEAEYLHRQGFANVHVIDLTDEPLKNLKSRVPDFPDQHIHQGDFFRHEGVYDYIVEQTMFCAVDPVMRRAYAEKAHELLEEGGKLVGVLFNREFEGGPPFGGNITEYLSYFDPLFSEVMIEPCYNSIEPRSGTEVFIKMVK